MKFSKQRGKIVEALAAVQAQVDGIPRDATNTHFNSKYATLSSVLAVLRPLWLEHELLVTQSASGFAGGVLTVRTRVEHVPSGEYFQADTPIIVGKADAQGVGSALTYGYRYSLMGIFCVPPVDDDGEAAVGRPAASPKVISGAQAKKLAAALVEAQADEVLFCEYFGIDDIGSLPANRFDEATAILNRKVSMNHKQLERELDKPLSDNPSDDHGLVE